MSLIMYSLPLFSKRMNFFSFPPHSKQCSKEKNHNRKENNGFELTGDCLERKSLFLF